MTLRPAPCAAATLAGLAAYITGIEAHSLPLALIGAAALILGATAFTISITTTKEQDDVH